jgi:riboflavin synthase
MFTGLVETVGEVATSEPTSGGMRLHIGSALASELAAGDSVAVNGVCLTVVAATAAAFRADVGPETLRVTTLGGLARGALVNLERPLRADGRFGGHFVQGHVDAVGTIDDVKPGVDFCWFTIGFTPNLARYIVHKGSIAVDGISLTVASLGTHRFDIQVVPFTLEHTSLKRATQHDRVNIECDMVGKYVVRAAELAGLSHVKA